VLGARNYLFVVSKASLLIYDDDDDDDDMADRPIPRNGYKKENQETERKKKNKYPPIHIHITLIGKTKRQQNYALGS
jgi:hypothetical protein